MRYRRTAALLLAALLLLGTGAVSCKRMVEEALPEKTEITIWYTWDLAALQEELAVLMDGFNHSQDRIEVEAQYVPEEDFNKRLALSMADGTLPDLAMIDSADFMFLQATQSFADLTDEIGGLSDYLPQALSPCTVDGRVYGLPFGMNCLALFYNSTIFKAAGCEPPSTWEEFRRAAVEADYGGHVGFAATGLLQEETVYQFLPILWSMGGDVDEIDSAQSAEAFGLIRDLVDVRAMNPENRNLPQSDLTDQFISGNVGMVFQTSLEIDRIRRENPTLRFGVVPVPAGTDQVTVAGGEVIGVTKGGHEAESIEFLRYIADEDRMAGYMDRFGFLAPREAVMVRQFPDDPQKQLFIELFQTAESREVSREWPFISEVISDAVHQTMKGEREVTDILKEAASRIRAVREGRS